VIGLYSLAGYHPARACSLLFINHFPKAKAKAAVKAKAKAASVVTAAVTVAAA
jgi:hypothetical protein